MVSGKKPAAKKPVVQDDSDSEDEDEADDDDDDEDDKLVDLADSDSDDGEEVDLEKLMKSGAAKKAAKPSVIAAPTSILKKSPQPS